MASGLGSDAILAEHTRYFSGIKDEVPAQALVALTEIGKRLRKHPVGLRHDAVPERKVEVVIDTFPLA